MEYLILNDIDLRIHYTVLHSWCNLSTRQPSRKKHHDHVVCSTHTNVHTDTWVCVVKRWMTSGTLTCCIVIMLVHDIQDDQFTELLTLVDTPSRVTSILHFYWHDVSNTLDQSSKHQYIPYHIPVLYCHFYEIVAFKEQSLDTDMQRLFYSTWPPSSSSFLIREENDGGHRTKRALYIGIKPLCFKAEESSRMILMHMTPRSSGKLLEYER